MQEAAQAIEEYTQGFSFEQFRQDRMRVDAVLRNLEIIGEAARNIPEEMRNRYPAGDWRKVCGLRDVVIHQYFKVDLAIIWDILQNKLPKLRQVVALMLEES
jgi:uncharacterized protein with HEPN domain